MPKGSRRPTREQRHYQREFIGWLAEHKSRLGGRAVRAQKTVRHVRLEVEGLNPAIRIEVRSKNIGVDVWWRGRWMDRICDIDMYPHWIGDVLVCDECAYVGPPQGFADLAALRADHQFKPLLQWVEDVLLPARVLEITLLAGGSCGAALLQEQLPTGRRSSMAEFLRTFKSRKDTGPQNRELHQFHLPVWMDT